MQEKIHNSSNKKRENYLSWDETFMLVAGVIGQRSKDPNTQIGACVVDENNVIVGLGYNGFPRGCSDDVLPWQREGNFLEKKYAYVVHAERNAIYNANKYVKGCKLYCYLFPCNECAKTIIQVGIKEVIYAEDWYHDSEEVVASRKMLELAGVSYRQYIPKNNLQDILCKSEKKEPIQNVEKQKIKIEETEIKAEINNNDKNKDIINFRDDESSYKKTSDDEPNQFIFENIFTN